MLSGEVAKRYNHRGLKEDTINVTLRHGRTVVRRVPGARRDLQADRRRQRLCRQGPLGRLRSSCVHRNSKIVAEDSIIVEHTRALRRDRGQIPLPEVWRASVYAVRNSGAIAIVEAWVTTGTAF